MNNTTKFLFWVSLPIIAIVAVFALGLPYVGIPMAMAIVIAAIAAGITHSSMVKVALVLFSASYLASGWADMQGKLQIAKEKAGEIADAKKTRESALKTAKDGPPKFRRWREAQAAKDFDTRVEAIEKKYEGKGIDGIDASNELLATLRIVSKAGKELATAFLIELTAMAWGSALFPVLGIGRKQQKKQVSAKRSAAAKKGWETRRAKAQKPKELEALPMAMVQSAKTM